MKRIIFMSIGMAFLLLLAGCGKQEETAQTKEKIKQEAAATKASLGQLKQEYQEKSNQKLAEYRQKLADLKIKAAQAQGEAKARLEKSAADLQKKTDELQQKLQEMQAATGKAWDDLKSQADDAMNKLQKEYDQATSNKK